jgi:hypothetical protein
MSGDYPADWDEIAGRVKGAADWCCEHCGHRHYPGVGRCLTVHHLDGDKGNCAHTNLVALCQVCHLHIQAHFVPGQMMLPGFARPCWMSERGLG